MARPAAAELPQNVQLMMSPSTPGAIAPPSSFAALLANRQLISVAPCAPVLFQAIPPPAFRAEFEMNEQFTNVVLRRGLYEVVRVTLIEAFAASLPADA
jgi:hypothetical protein